MRVMVYSSVESIIKSLGISDGSPELQEVHRICGFVHNLPSKEISVESYVALLRWAATRYYPDLSQSAGLYQLGLKFLEGYRATILGRVQLASIHLIGPHRLIKRVPELFSKSTNFGERTVKQVDTQLYLVSFRGIPVPADFYCGLFHAGLKAAGVEHPSITFEQIGLEDVDFKVSW